MTTLLTSASTSRYCATGAGKPRILHLPIVAYYALGLVSDMVAAARKKEPTTNRYRIKTRLAHVRWDCNKAKHMLQWRPRVPLRDGLTRVFREHAGTR